MADDSGAENAPPKLLNNSNNLLTKSVILNREIHGFLIGGEKRLLFSEINEELYRRGVQREEIFEKLKILQLQLCEATAEQRFIVAGHLGLKDPTPLGEQYLIRQTDAERLCGAVIPTQKLATDADITENTFKVQHEIFGKSRGLFIPELYIQSSSECITCIQCRALLSPQDFVRHNHSPPKNQVRHWGLEATRWWRYVFVAKDQENREYYQRLLDELKQRFSSQCDDVTTLPATIKTTAADLGSGSNNSTGSSNTTASVLSQLAVLQDVASKNTTYSEVESFIALPGNHIIESNRGRYDEPSSNRAYNEASSSFAEIMASAMAAAAAAAVASSAVKTATGQALSSFFVPPPNIRLQDIFKVSAPTTSTGSDVSSSYKQENDGDETQYLAPKRLRLELPAEADLNNTDSSSVSDSSHYINEALAAVAAITSHARLQSESASTLALPAQLLLGHSRPLPVAPSQKNGDGGVHSQSPRPEDVVAYSDSDEDNNNNNRFTSDNEFIKDTILRQQLAEEIALLKSAFARQLAASCQRQQKPTDESGNSMLSALLESASAEREVERLFGDGLVDEFCRLRSKHHAQVAERVRHVVSSVGSSASSNSSIAGIPTPKHMTVMGKYLGELQEAKNNLEARVRELSAELSRAKEDHNALARRLDEKEREANELRHAVNAILIGTSPPGFFTSSTASAISAALMGSNSSKQQVDHLATYQQQLLDQRRNLMFLMAGDKIGRNLNCHTSDELAAVLNASSRIPNMDRVLSSST